MNEFWEMNKPRIHQYPLAKTVDRNLKMLQSICHQPDLKQLSASQLMGERSYLTGATFNNRMSPGKSCRLIDCKEDTIAVNLPREDDWGLTAAWLGGPELKFGDWDGINSILRRKTVHDLLPQAQLLGIAAAPVNSEIPNHKAQPIPQINPEFTVSPKPPLVLDLSSLWAGPLCGHILHLCGAKVIKLESITRPDGARQGNEQFFKLLNQGKSSVALDLSNENGHKTLTKIINKADIVIESSRPRALEQMGINPQALVKTRKNFTWISITGYGRQEPYRNWIAYGDDAGVAAGLSQLMKRATGNYQIAGDAIADPITGIQAALLAWQNWLGKRSRLISLSLRDVTTYALQAELDREGIKKTTLSLARWWNQATSRTPHEGIIERPINFNCQDLGASNDVVLQKLEIA